MERELNRQQRLFCHEYLVDFNATAAAIRSNYSKKNAARIGHELLNKPQVKHRVEEIQRAREAVSTVTAAHIEEEVSKIAMMKPEDFILALGKGYHMTLKDKLKALEMMCRIRGMFNDKMEFSFRGMNKEQVKTVLLEWIEANANGNGPTVSSAPRLVSQGG